MGGMKRVELSRVVKICEQLSPKYAAIVAIGVATGCRISEILALKRGDLINPKGEFREKIAFVKLKVKQGGKHRSLAIPQNLQRFIIRHLAQEAERGFTQSYHHVFRGKFRGAPKDKRAPASVPLSRLSVYREFRKVLGDGYGTHWMRKTFAYEIFYYFLKQNSNDPMRALELTRSALGHARIDTTVKYLGLMEQSIEEAQNELFGHI